MFLIFITNTFAFLSHRCIASSIVNSTYTESAQGKIEGFKNSFQTLSTTTLNADIFKGVVDGGTAFFNILTKIMDIGSGLPAIIATISGFMSAKGKGKQNNNCRSLNALSYKIA